MGYLDAEAQLTGNFVTDHWTGRHSLPRAYWINGFLIAGVGGGFLTVLATSLADTDLSLQTASALALAAMGLGVALWVWSVVGIWRSADHHVERGGSANWAGIAKALVILGALGMTGKLVNAAPGVMESARLAANNDTLGSPAKLLVNGTTLALEGPISQGTAALVAERLSENPSVRRISLNSIGGRIRDAEQIAHLVKSRGLDTEAINECDSACTMVLLAGEKRAAAIGSRIGFHQPDFPGLQPSERAEIINDMRAAYLAAGLPGSFVRRALESSPDQMWYPTEPEMLKAGVLNGMTLERVRQDQIGSASETNRRGPQRLDEITTLTHAKAAGETLTFYYEVNADRASVNRTELEKTLRAGNKSQICTQPLIPELIQSGAIYRFVYQDRAGLTLASVQVDSC